MARDVLAEIKADSSLKAIPVVVLATSASEEDVLKIYKLQASLFVTKELNTLTLAKLSVPVSKKLDRLQKIVKSN
jgi:CheY-like chemotaxis protein